MHGCHKDNSLPKATLRKQIALFIVFNTTLTDWTPVVPHCGAQE